MVVLLAQVWVVFHVCYLDSSVDPPRFIPDPLGREMYVRPEEVTAIFTPHPDIGGIDCVQIGGHQQNLFVVGTVEQVSGKLTPR